MAELPLRKVPQLPAPLQLSLQLPTLCTSKRFALSYPIDRFYAREGKKGLANQMPQTPYGGGVESGGRLRRFKLPLATP